jgi:hypothetical protein
MHSHLKFRIQNNHQKEILHMPPDEKFLKEKLRIMAGTITNLGREVFAQVTDPLVWKRFAAWINHSLSPAGRASVIASQIRTLDGQENLDGLRDFLVYIDEGDNLSGWWASLLEENERAKVAAILVKLLNNEAVTEPVKMPICHALANMPAAAVTALRNAQLDEKVFDSLLLRIMEAARDR